MQRVLSGMLAALGALACTPVLADALAVVRGLYDIEVQTSMPHLEENLRYATQRSSRCLDTQPASSLFPLLEHQAFAGCRLLDNDADTSARVYTLACDNAQAASGYARISVEGGFLRATLAVTMGGKNMTFSQRVTAARVGPCNDEGSD